MLPPINPIMRHRPQCLPRPKLIPLHITPKQLRGNITRPQPVARRPLPRPVLNSRQTLPVPSATGIRDRGIGRAVELEDGHGTPAASPVVGVRIALDVRRAGVAGVFGLG